MGASIFLVIYENSYFIIFRWFLKLFSLYLLKPPMNDFKIDMYKLVLLQNYGNKCQKSCKHITRTFSVQASCERRRNVARMSTTFSLTLRWRPERENPSFRQLQIMSHRTEAAQMGWEHATRERERERPDDD